MIFMWLSIKLEQKKPKKKPRSGSSTLILNQSSQNDLKKTSVEIFVPHVVFNTLIFVFRLV